MEESIESAKPQNPKTPKPLLLLDWTQSKSTFWKGFLRKRAIRYRCPKKRDRGTSGLVQMRANLLSRRENFKDCLSFD